MTADQNTTPLWGNLITSENLRMIGVFVIILVVTALLANLTLNNTLRADAASNVPDDIEDIGDGALEALEDIQEGVAEAASEFSVTSDEEAFRSAITGTLEEETAGYVQNVGLYRPDGTAFVLDMVDDATVITLDEEAAAETVDPAAVEESTWTVHENGVRYLMPMEADSEAEVQPLVWVDVATATLNDLLAEAAAGEALFAETQLGYAVLVSSDNTVIAQFNQSNASPGQIESLTGNLIEDNYNEQDEYYEVETDPLIDESSFVVTMPTDIADWQVIGAFPVSEVPTRNIVESTENLFQASEVGDTISAWVDSAVEFLNEDVGWLFRGLRAPIETVILTVEDILLQIHWSIIIVLTTIIAALAGGRRIAYIAAFGMFAIGLLGLWDLTMTTMAMLLTSMGFCILVGIPLGIWAARNDSVNEIVRSVLDAMQTIHPFVYLVPIVILFGIGKVPGTIATIIFALPPMVRLTNLGIRQVPEDVIEAARAFGSNDWQLLRDVQIPLAMPSIMAGVNQTLMLSLSMVVIVALIAGGGLGQEIYRAIQNSDIGRAVVSGVAVLLLAVVIDRISQGGTNPRHAEE